MNRGLLTKAQYAVLVRRARGMTQKEAAKELGTTRANVSMIELRARRKVELARDTVRAYQAALEEHTVRIPRGTRFYDIPPAVLREADRWGIHVQSNIVEIVRIVRAIQPGCLERGKTTREIAFSFNPSGRLRLAGGRGQKARSTASH